MNDDDLFIEKQQKKAYEVDFAVLSTFNLKTKQDKEVSQVSVILGMIWVFPQFKKLNNEKYRLVF